MTFKKSVIAVFCAAAICGGCATQKKAENILEEARKELANKQSMMPKKQGSRYVDFPPAFSHAKDSSKIPAWARVTTPIINAKSIPFSLVADQMSRLGGVNTLFADVDPRLRVSVQIPAGTPLWQAIDTLAASTGYGYEFVDGGVEWRSTLVRVYTLPAPAGERDYKIGSDDSKAGGNINFNAGGTAGSSNSSTTQVKTTESGSEQYSRITGKPDRYTEALEALQALVAKEGVVSGIKGSNQIVVKAGRNVISQTDAFMKEYMGDMGRQARLEAKILMFSSNEGESLGADWNLVYKATNGLLKFDTQNNGTALTGTSPSRFAAEITGGKWSGSQLFINALQEQGSVTIVTEPVDIIKNNTPSQLSNIQSQTFTASTSVLPNPDGAPTTQVNPGVVDQGLKFFILPKFTGDDKVSLWLSSNLSTLNSITKTKANENYQEQPNVSTNGINKEMDIRFGETWVISGIKQTITRTGERSTLGSVFLGGEKSADLEVVEMILLITVTEI